MRELCGVILEKVHCIHETRADLLQSLQRTRLYYDCDDCTCAQATSALVTYKPTIYGRDTYGKMAHRNQQKMGFPDAAIRIILFLRSTCSIQTLLREHTIICNISTAQTRHANEQCHRKARQPHTSSRRWLFAAAAAAVVTVGSASSSVTIVV